jgi:amidase
MVDKLWKLGVAELALMIRSGQISSREAIQAHFERIEEVNPQLNAVTVVLEEQALEAADKADQRLAAGEAVGPLHGVPMTVKENIDLVGSATTHGIVVLKENFPNGTAPHIAQLIAAGAIPIGRTNLPDLGMRWHTDNDLRGATLNPWNSERTPGGSSGGDAAALATGMTPLGMGNDLAGSLRWPSQCCGTTAIRPTYGRVTMVSTFEDIPDPPLAIQLFAVNGPMARHARDLRLALGHMSGPDPRDPRWVPAPLTGPKMDQPIPVAVTVDPANQGIDPDVGEAIRKAASALSDAGYEVEEIEPPSIARAAELYFQIMNEHGQIRMVIPIETLVSKDQLRFRDAYSEAMVVSMGNSSEDVFSERMGIAKEWEKFQARWPLILGPISTIQPFSVGFDLIGGDSALTWLRSIRLIVIVNMLGLPSVAVPAGVSNGLPQGVQIIGQRYREDLCLDAAEAIEDRLGTVTPIDPL